LARPAKTGLDYFPMDTSFEDNLELFEAEQGVEGLGILIKLWQKIYKEGYFIEWKEDNILLFSKKINAEITRINAAINCCFKRNIFDKKMYEKYQILTSRGIQKRFFSACKTMRRVEILIVKEYRLINGEYDEVITEETSINSGEMKVNTEETIVNYGKPLAESTQKKGKEIKREETKQKENILSEFDTFFDSVWNLYPEKIGKNRIKATQKKELYSLGFEKISLCIERYIRSVEEKRNNGFKTLNFQNGSTFFSGGYKDFLEEQKTAVTKNKCVIIKHPDH